MQKLEEIMHAEDSARHRLVDAREQAQQIAKEAVAEAQLVRASVKREAAEAALAAREATVAEAEREADAIRAEADVQLGSLLVAAESRVPRAIEAVSRELMR